MATSPNYGALTTPNDYNTQIAEIERKRKFAQALQEQGMTPMGETQMVGGWAIPKSPIEGVGKMAQALSGAYQQKELNDQQQQLAKAESEATSADIRSLFAPETPRQPTGAVYADNGSMQTVSLPQAQDTPDEISNRRIQKATELGGRQSGIAQALASQIIQQEMKGQQFRSFMNQYGGGGVTPTGAGGGQGGFAGISPLALAFQQAGFEKPAEWAQAAYSEQQKPVNVRPQGTIAVPDGRGGYRQAYYSGQVGEGQTRSPEGTVSVMPGYLEGQAALGKTPKTKVEYPDGTYDYLPDSQIVGGRSNPLPIGPQNPVQMGNTPQVTPSGDPMFVNTNAMQPNAPQGGMIPTSSVVAQSSPLMQQNLAVIDAELRKPGQTPNNIALLQRERDNVLRTSGSGGAGGSPVIPTQPAGTVSPAPPVIPADVPGQGRFGQPQTGKITQAGETSRAQNFGEDRGKLEAARPQQANAGRTSLAAMERLSNVTTELLNHPGLNSITGKVDQYPITDITPEARSARALQGTLVKQSAVSTLQTMRDMSKSGGAVGQVTEKEWPILEQQLAALDAAQSPQDYKVALQNMNNQIQGSMQRVKQAYAETYGQPLQYDPIPYQTQGRQNADALIGGSRGNTGTPSGMTVRQGGQRNVVKFSEM